MRIVKSLKEVCECPNCGSQYYLRETKNEFGRPYIVCINCHEELFGDEDTYSTTTTRKQKLAMQLDDIIHDIPLYAQNQSQLFAYQKICEAFGEIIKYLEE